MNSIAQSESSRGRTVLIPTWSGHLEEATALIESIRATESRHLDIVIVISAEEIELFEDLAARLRCEVFLIEELVADYTGLTISGAKLLRLVDRYRYQTLKKYLGIAKLQGDVLLVDSESRIVRDLHPIFDWGLEETTVFYTQRPWGDMPRGLAKDVNHEVNYLTGVRQPYWYFESLNWLYSSDVVRGLLAELKEKHGTEWAFRPRQLFESQLYFQYARRTNVPYRFIPADEFLAQHFGPDRAKSLLRALYNSPLVAVGVFEYLARFLTREEYAAFISQDEVLRHFRLVRYEPYEFYDIISDIRKRIASSRYFFGEAAMHRGPFLRARTAVLIDGRFATEQVLYNVPRFLAGVDCDVFVSLPTGHALRALVQDILDPVEIVEVGASEGATLAPLAATYQAMMRHEASSGVPYGAVVKMRPDIFSNRSLRDMYWDVSETVSDLTDIVIVPDRHWGRGINIHFLAGLRPSMGLLLDELTGTAGRGETEYDTARAVLKCGLRPIPGHLPYVLGAPPLAEVSKLFREQESHASSRKVRALEWKDATAFLENRLSEAPLNASGAPAAAGTAPAGAVATAPRPSKVGGRAAVLLCGHFANEQDLYNARRLLAGFDCDIFMSMERNHWLKSLAQDVLKPIEIAEIDDYEDGLGRRSVAYAAADRRKQGKPDRQADAWHHELVLNGMIMFDQLSAARDAFLRHETKAGMSYRLVIKTRPDIFSAGGLRSMVADLPDAILDSRDVVVFPDRFWVEGINDHVFLGSRTAMGALLDRLTAEQFVTSDHLTAQYHIGRALLAAGLKPLSREFPYILGYLPLDQISGALRFQAARASTRSVGAREPEDGASYLEEALANVSTMRSLADGAVRPVKVDADYLAARDPAGGTYLFLSRPGGSGVVMRRWLAPLLRFVPYLLFAGLLHPERGRPVTLRDRSPAAPEARRNPAAAASDGAATIPFAPTSFDVVRRDPSGARRPGSVVRMTEVPIEDTSLARWVVTAYKASRKLIRFR